MRDMRFYGSPFLAIQTPFHKDGCVQFWSDVVGACIHEDCVYNFGVLLLVLVSGEEDAVKLVDKAKKNFFVDIQFNHQHDGTYKPWEFF
jgi:hypothetical protein